MTVTEPVVLVLGDTGDWSATEVGKHLDARGIRWVLLDTADFPQRMSLSAHLEAGHAGWRGEVSVDGQALRLSEVTAVYYRKPCDFDLPEGLSGPERRFSHAQARVGLGGVLASLPVRWLSHPSALADAEYKPRQLALLRQAGLATPPSLVTNDPAAVRAFAAAHGRDLVVKPLAEPIVWEGGGESVVFTRRMKTSTAWPAWILRLIFSRPFSTSGVSAGSWPWAWIGCSPWRSTLAAASRMWTGAATTHRCGMR